MAAFMQALLPDQPDVDFTDVRHKLGDTANEIFDPRRFDDPILQRSVPTVFSVLYWLPVFCFWLAWRPVPFTWLSIERRQTLFLKLEHSRLYAFRGLYLAGKMFCCMMFFHHEATWDYVGYDHRGELDPVVHPTALDDLRMQVTGDAPR